MIGSLITSQTRIKLLRKFFLNSNTSAHLRGLESEFGESTNAIRVELNRLEDAGLLNSYRNGNKKLYHANRSHPLFSEIHNIIIKEAGIDKIIEAIKKLGKEISIYLTGEFAHGMDSQVIDIILIGNDINNAYLSRKIIQAEKIIGRKINCVIINADNAETELKRYKPAELFLAWSSNGKLLK